MRRPLPKVDNICVLFPINKIDIGGSCSGSPRVSRVGEGVLAIADFRCGFLLLPIDQYSKKVRFGEPPKPTRGTRALPGRRAHPRNPRSETSISAFPIRRVFGNADRCGADRTSDRAGAVQE